MDNTKKAKQRDEARNLRAAILDWYRENRRDLPWRRTQDPYAVWISEVMLQQTRVSTVIPYFERFLGRWPDVNTLAAADPDEVRASWSGLGYYRRAELMLKAAGSIARDHGGLMPKTAARLRELPGFGRYTAGAVASIAHGEAVPAVDGNVARVIARLYGLTEDISAGKGAEKVWGLATALALGPAPGDLNQGLIELGALVCTSRAPKCSACPVAYSCEAKSRDAVHQIPRPKKRALRRILEVTGIVVLRGNFEVLLEKQPEGGLFGGLWCAPMLEGRLDPDGVIDEMTRRYGVAPRRVEIVGELKHVLTHRDIIMRVAVARDDFETPTIRTPAITHSGPDLLRPGTGALASEARSEAKPSADGRPNLLRPGTGALASEARSEAKPSADGRPDLLRPGTGALAFMRLDELENHGVPSLTVRTLRAALPRSLIARVKLPGRNSSSVGGKAGPPEEG